MMTTKELQALEVGDRIPLTGAGFEGVGEVTEINDMSFVKSKDDNGRNGPSIEIIWYVRETDEIGSSIGNKRSVIEVTT